MFTKISFPFPNSVVLGALRSLVLFLILASVSYANAGAYESNPQAQGDVLQIVMTPDGYPIIWYGPYGAPDWYEEIFYVDVSDTVTSGVQSCYTRDYSQGRLIVYTDNPTGECDSDAMSDGAKWYKDFYVDGRGKVRVYYDADGVIVGTHTPNEHMVFRGDLGIGLDNSHFTQPGDTEVVGTIAGSFEVSPMGASTYSIDAVLPPGIAGMKPILGFNYSSQGSNGHMGVGWAIDGLSSITRCRKTLATDGYNEEIRYDRDVFCIDGERMLWQENAGEFRTEKESFRRITHVGTRTDPATFTVRSKSGLTSKYIRASSLQGDRLWLLHSIKDTLGNRITYHYDYDLDNGDYKILLIRYAYTSDDDDSYKAEIEFKYDDILDNSFEGWVAGKKVTNHHRLINVKAYSYDQIASKFKLARDYRFNYDQDSDNGSIFIDAIKLCSGDIDNDGDSECYRQTKLEWTKSVSGVGSRTSSGYCADGNESDCIVNTDYGDRSYIQYPDINGDGYSDLCYIKQGGGIQCQYSNGHGGWNTGITINACTSGDGCTGTYFAGYEVVDNNDVQIWADFDGRPTLQFVDVTADGMPDLVYRTTDGVKVRFNNVDINGAFGSPVSTGHFRPVDDKVAGFAVVPRKVDEGTYHNLYFPDFNGDGHRDLCYRSSGSGIQCHVNTKDTRQLWSAAALNNYSGLLYHSGSTPYGICAEGSTRYGRCDQGDNYPTIQFVDINADGMDDLVYRGDQGMQAWYSNGYGFNYQPDSFMVPGSIDGSSMRYLCYNSDTACDWQTIRFADVNGDGLPDLCYRAHYGITCWENRGSDSIKRYTVYATDAPYSADYKRWIAGFEKHECVRNDPSDNPCDSQDNYGNIHFMDINADGKSDMVYRGDKGLEFFLSDGKTFQPYYHTDICEDGAVGNGVCNDQNNWRTISFADFNGDGRADLVYRGDQGIQTWVNRSYQPNLVSRVENGLGDYASVDYSMLSDSSVYEKSNSFVSLASNVVLSPMRVVKGYQTSDGNGGTHETRYRYSDLRYNLEGRGLLGFKEIWSVDSKNVTNYIKYYQHFPYTGIAEETVVAVADNSAFSIPAVNKQISYTSADTAVFPSDTNAIFATVGTTESKSKEPNTSSWLITKNTASDYDIYGNVTEIVEVTAGGGSQFTKTTTNVYKPGLENQHNGRLSDATVLHVEADGSTQTRVSSFEYYDGSGLLKKEFIEPESAGVYNQYPVDQLVTTYTYDNYGNQTSKTVSGADFTDRVTTTTYDASGRFVQTIANSLGHKEFHEYEPVTGQLITQIGPYKDTGSVTLEKAPKAIFDYDGFGRVITKRTIDQTGQFPDVVTDTQYSYCVVTCPQGAYYRITTTVAGLPPTTVYFDQKGREVYSEKTGFDGSDILTATEYDEYGRVRRTSRPYFEGDSPEWAVTTDYDIQDRPESIRELTTDENNSVVIGTSTIIYDGLSTTTINALSQRKTVVSDALGRQVSVTDDSDNSMTTSYTYQGNAQVVTTTDSMDNQMVTITDVRDHKRAMTDPDMGTWTYDYYATGELKQQMDARGFVTHMAYDQLGRLLTRTDAAEGTTVAGQSPTVAYWIYDMFYPGTLSLAANNNYSRLYQQDSLGRNKSVVSTYTGEPGYTSSKTYDAYSRTEVLTYPGGEAVRNIYNANGYLEKVVDEAANDNVYWQANYRSAEDQLTNFTYGNGVNTVRGYLLDRLVMNNAEGFNPTERQFIQADNYYYDELANLKQRDTLSPDGLSTLSESFSYDNLNRLHTTSIGGNTATNILDELGNLQSKQTITVSGQIDSINYQYDPVNNKRLVSTNGAAGRQLVYDANGNVTNNGSQIISWTPYNKVHTIFEGQSYSVFMYDEGRERYRRYHTGGKRVDYIMPGNNLGAHYEHRLAADSSVTHKYFIYAGSEMVAIKSVTDASESMEYLHKDHLGSVVVVTNEDGIIVSERSFTAYGAARSSDWSSIYQSALLPSIMSVSAERGYTGHEHMTDFNLVNMNGRIYDPALGRFLSADPFVQFPDNMQSLSRYSYVLNNPLNTTDPSGYSSAKDIVTAAVTIAVAVYAPQLFVAMSGNFGLSAVGAGIVGGLSAGFANGLLSGGGLRGAIRGGLTGAVSGMTFGALHTAQYGFGKVVAHGLAGGVSSEMSGGSFKSGFLSAGFTQGASPMFGGAARTMSNRAVNAVKAAVIGGTAAVIGGGKFANGAITGAFSRMFNDDNGEGGRYKKRSGVKVIDAKLVHYKNISSDNELVDIAINTVDAYVSLKGRGTVQFGMNREVWEVELSQVDTIEVYDSYNGETVRSVIAGEPYKTYWRGQGVLRNEFNMQLSGFNNVGGYYVRDIPYFGFIGMKKSIQLNTSQFK